MFSQIVSSLNQDMYALIQRGYNGSELFYMFPQKNPRKKANIAKMLFFLKGKPKPYSEASALWPENLSPSLVCLDNLSYN